MAVVNAVLTFALPEDVDSDVLALYASATKEGSYSLTQQLDYQYGQTQIEPPLFDDVFWYKIQFLDTANGTEGPLSDPVFGGTFSSSAPFLAVSSATDGANYATTQDVYDYSGLTSEDVPTSRISAALRRARAVIDYRTAEMGIERFVQFGTETARRKYNASLRILKEAEINIALGNVYQNLSDDRIIANSREGASASSNAISIGGTSVSGDDIADRSENIIFLATLSSRYFGTGELLLASLDTNSVRLVGSDLNIRMPRFLYPFNGWS
jgi:hypothetical protein